MSYAQAIKWSRKHPKGTRQPVIMSTCSGFWPSQSFLEEDYWPYLDTCKRDGKEPLDCKTYYKSKLRT